MEASDEAQESKDLNIRRTSPEEAEQAVATSGRGRTSQYEHVADAWDEASDAGESVVLEDVTKNDVQNIRNLIYRRFDKEDVIVRSAKKGDDSFNVAIRERQEGEYLRDEDSGENGEVDEDAEVVEQDNTTEDTVEEDGGDEFSPSFE